MPKINAVAQVIELIGRRDFKQAREAVEYMIKYEKQCNRNHAAAQLKRALSRWPQDGELKELPSNIKNMVWEQNADTTMSNVYMADDVRGAIKQLIRERNQFDLLDEMGLPIKHTILLAGPHGNGKTSLASALASQLKLKLLSIKMHAIMSSALGGITKNIGGIFEYAMMDDCLLFLDEFESIGASRDNSGTDVSREYNNTMTTILTSIDRMPESTVLIAATNMPDALDPAVLRRFDLKIWMDNPSTDAIAKYIEDYQVEHNVLIGDPERLAEQMDGSSWSAVERNCINLHKALVLGTEEDPIEWYGKEA